MIAGVSCIEVVPPGGMFDGTIVYCFGGGFVCGSAFEDLIVAAPIAVFSGARVILPKYRLAPEHPWPRCGR